jgi:ADP-heptose:LPS heptosyltransferase
MRKAIVTIVCGERYEEIWKRTEPFFWKYAEKCGADLIVLDDPSHVPTAHWLKFSIYELLKKDYHRIAFIDADIIIREDSPSLFDIVPEDSFGIFNEGEVIPERNICIYEVMNKYAEEMMRIYKIPKFTYDGKSYFNTGVMVVSREHRHIFKIVEAIKPLRHHFGEQTFLNYKIMLSGVKVFPLDYKFNRMSCMDRILGVSRLDSYFIHYAGDGDLLFAKLERDIEQWKKDAPDYKYKKQIFVWAFGGLGDVISTEPVIRYIRNRMYPDAEIYLMSKDWEVYDHIDGINFSKDYPKKEFDAVMEINTHHTTWENFEKFSPFTFTHCIDWTSQKCLGRQIPDKDKHIQLDYKRQDLEKCREIYQNLEELVLVHPGVGWESKTFPTEYWQNIIDRLKEEGFKVGIIGRDMKFEQHITPHKYQPVNTEGCVDFRDKLEIKELFALISKAKTLITNDSMPIHVAGAFDNNIILIPTCKHPDMIMPWRHGYKYYKAKALYKKLMEDDQFYTGDNGEVWVVKNIPKGHKIEEYLPDVEEVILTVKQFDDESDNFDLSFKKENRNDLSCQLH